MGKCMGNWKFWLVLISLIIATGFLGFSSFISILFFGIDFSTLTFVVLFILGLYVIIKASIMKRHESKKYIKGNNH